MTETTALTAELERWIIDQVRAGQPPEAVLEPLLASGWEEQVAIDAIERVTRNFLEAHARETGLPLPSRVPAPIGLNGSSAVDAGDREVHVLASMRHPRVIVFGNVLSHEECDRMIELARSRLSRSATVDLETGGDIVHEGRTSQGMSFERGGNALCRRIEARIARLLDWPVDHGEGLQVLRYGPGAEYKPHYDYFDPDRPGAAKILQRGGQRVASLVMYLNTPRSGGATTFPEVGFEAAAVKGNAVFFSYDRPHPMTLSLHGGAPVTEGEKWVATKWLREHTHG
ncbi:2OG-Fe(II) oxygenase [Marilutibacter chinensis]|uniref:2OG-Fe(II) oxygenase n=1 Tax=Marilutibacter chinensis TaxID=2912247 RepID=A0ABS9HW43_9GAMM|nr:2OG-Fe(II) oxygenase [Lysobacter chinensis]MCF7222612.1 2OG-Fe(II) oxygenase [Lysobacter chinensis]